jgi:integration host factor subunit alpha
MAGKSITRADLADAVYQNVGLSRTESADLVEQVLREICTTLASGENVKLSSFGIFRVRDQDKRIGRNPKTGDEVPIEPRKAVTFSASDVLKAYVNAGQ